MSPRRSDRLSLAALERSAADATAAAERARVQRDRLAAVLGAAAEGVVVVDPDGIELFRNRAAQRFRGARHADAVAEGEIDAALEQARAGVATEREVDLHGPPRTVLFIRGLPLYEQEVLLGAAVLVDDVTDERRVESVRRDFVANVSHELKTPIGALEVLAETLVVESDPAVTRPLAEGVVKEAERLGRIVDDLLDLSLIETQEAPTRDLIAVDELVGEAVDRLRPAAAAAGIALRVVGDSSGAMVACDRRQVISAVTNLLDNAIKYSEQESAVEIATEVCDTTVAVIVRDRGIGIPSRDLQRIFERFYRVDQARSRDTGGTGLGLAIVRHVAQAHGGEVTVESVEGEGSTFRFSLPLAVVGRDPEPNGSR